MGFFHKLWSQRWRLTYLIRYRGDKVAYLRSLGVRIGKGVSIYTTINEFGTEPWLIEIGNNVTIAGGVRFINHDGASRLFRDQIPNMNPFGNRFGKIFVHHNSFIGHSSLILPDVEIGPHSVVGAGSVVTKSVPPKTVVAGNPARFLFSIEEYILRYQQKMLPLKAQTRNRLRSELTRIIWGEER